MIAEANEELVHLTQVGRIPMGVKHGELRVRVPDVQGHDLAPASRTQPPDLDTLVRPHAGHGQPPRRLVLHHQLVRRRVGREEGEPRRHRRLHPAHFLITSRGFSWEIKTLTCARDREGGKERGEGAS